MEDFIYDYFKKKKKKKLSKVGSDGYALLTISDNEILNNLKRECIRLKLSIKLRKWGKIDENKISRNLLFMDNKKNILDLFENGLSPTEIISKLELKKGVVYKHIRNFKNKNKELFRAVKLKSK